MGFPGTCEPVVDRPTVSRAVPLRLMSGIMDVVAGATVVVTVVGVAAGGAVVTVGTVAVGRVLGGGWPTCLAGWQPVTARHTTVATAARVAERRVIEHHRWC